ncbi:serine/threonine protein phosphatase [Brachybacterium sp. MASK1Z-5]|uniref:Serine/threonine protein phosphatase n=1 Tax=Brachybacterium halotolerans TaxID=2795215 RepID=A0ABS1BCJ3_9MICO|nr:serine/threonine protein phosphatase [Brachybacterium halotolerans]MBK0332370.1 serine/threonine protein phosphatase [Brachybacterium halotolerans]
MSTGASPRPDAADVFDHLRAEDGEHVGYMEMTADGGFVPYDLLWQRRGEPMDLDEAEAVLDGIGLRLLAEDWLLQEGAGWTRVRIREIDRDRVVVGRAIENMSGHVAKAIDLVGGIDVALPTDRLRLAGAAR